jgi:hypothetical protein
VSDLWTVWEVAEILGVGYDTVVRRFSKVKGVSPSQALKRRNAVVIVCCESRSQSSRSCCSPVAGWSKARRLQVPERRRKESLEHSLSRPKMSLFANSQTITKQHGAEAVSAKLRREGLRVEPLVCHYWNRRIIC